MALSWFLRHGIIMANHCGFYHSISIAVIIAAAHYGFHHCITIVVIIAVAHCGPYHSMVMGRYFVS
jgi:hypothetical protein